MRDYRIVEFLTDSQFRWGWAAHVDRLAGDQVLVVQRRPKGGYLLLIAEKALVPVEDPEPS